MGFWTGIWMKILSYTLGVRVTNVTFWDERGH